MPPILVVPISLIQMFSHSPYVQHTMGSSYRQVIIMISFSDTCDCGSACQFLLFGSSCINKWNDIGGPNNYSRLYHLVPSAPGSVVAPERHLCKMPHHAIPFGTSMGCSCRSRHRQLSPRVSKIFFPNHLLIYLAPTDQGCPEFPQRPWFVLVPPIFFFLCT